MNAFLWRQLRMVVGLLLGLSPGLLSGADVSLTFERDIRPIFKAYCLDCHGAEEELGGQLDLRLRRFLVRGGDSGPAIEAGNPQNSLLLQRVAAGEMPPRDVKLPEKYIAAIRQWIDSGAATARPEPGQIGKGIGITPEDRLFWAFQPVQRPEVPGDLAVPEIRTAIDALLLVKLRAKELHFSTETDRLGLLRRASLDLRGLSPTPDEAAQFFDDASPSAYEEMLDRLLASPHYGERWGRHWLDVAGYADSEGVTTADSVRPFAYKYRDYVIRSLNADKPFDQFITEQLAGDELVKPPYEDLTTEQIDKLVATGFLRMAGDGTGSGAPDQNAARNQVIGDTLKIVSSALLGLTVGCAQCHDHRHDPILQADYYRMRAIFEPAYDWKNWRAPGSRLISLYTAADRLKSSELEAKAGKVGSVKAKKQAEYVLAALNKELEKFDESLRETYRVAYYTPANKRTAQQQQIFLKNPFLRLHAGNLYQYNQKAADDLKTYDQRMSEIRSGKPFEDFLRVLTEIPGKVPVTYLFHRGNASQPKDSIAPGVLTITNGGGQAAVIPQNDPAVPSTGRRLAYARWLTSGQHPLTRRVLMNRMWMHHLGRGLVDTPSDFGSMGLEPTHPGLLDWLASELLEQEWSWKRMHQMIMASTVYRQRSQRDPARDAIDPENRFLWRKPIQRLEAEIVRDRILATSGEVNRQMHGPPVSVQADDVGQIVVAAGSAGVRRSVYVQVRRSMPVSMLRQFDMPDIKVNCEKRASSTVAPQSLALMNSSFILEQAEAFARRLQIDAGADRHQQVRRAWQVALARQPTERELERGLMFLTRQVAHLESRAAAASPDDETNTVDGQGSKAPPKLPAQLQALTSLCQVLMGSSEFLYSD
ncbi:MAG: PSD1 and planctomycete cytochrome C domain-containing protein [Planctomycetota bacterium]|nr:PSD1 and planctomycete cytochrome C domain-containing protein [Planctomycetota bacterium]